MTEKTEKDTIAGLISKAAAKLREDFNYIRKTNVHAGESGDETEDIVKEFLNHHLPSRFRATSGFVIDEDNQMSQHQDVIIYDALSAPVYRYEGDNQIVPADAVAGVIEVKSLLNKKELREGFDKIEDVKKLRKRPMGSGDQPSTGSPFSTTGTLGVIFAFRTETSLEKLAEHCAEFNEQYDGEERPDLIVILDKGSISYGVSLPGEPIREARRSCHGIRSRVSRA